MGMWGFHSWSGDAVMDFVGYDALTSQAKVNAVLEETWKNCFEPFEKLGVVCYILKNTKYEVPIDKLREVFNIAQKELTEKELDTWRGSEQRKRAVKKEMAMVLKAIGDKSKEELSEEKKNGRKMLMPELGVEVILTYNPHTDKFDNGVISTTLHETCEYCGNSSCEMDCPEFCEELTDRDPDRVKELEEERQSFLRYDVAVDTVESVILALACAGVDISQAPYEEAFKTALDAAAHYQ